MISEAEPEENVERDSASIRFRTPELVSFARQSRVSQGTGRVNVVPDSPAFDHEVSWQMPHWDQLVRVFSAVGIQKT